MKLKKFDFKLPRDEARKKKIILTSISVIALILIITIASTFAYFQSMENQNPINTSVGEFSSGDIIFAVTIDGVPSNTFPIKGEGYISNSVTCDKGATGVWNNKDWTIVVSNLTQSKTTCNIEFIEGEYGLGVEKDESMIAIMYNGSAWVKADESNQNATYKWYDYDAYKWANAVSVTASSRASYQSAAVGTTVNEADILAYYVYIPRYRYQLFNANNGMVEPQEISIEFENKYERKSKGTTNGEWLTHPAFTFGEDELAGIWVGKFETSPDPASSCYTSPSPTNCQTTAITPRIKANATTWIVTNVSTMFQVTRDMQKIGNIYGLSTSLVDSHMMKNVEWGAVAYLYHSKYGKYGNPTYSGVNKEIWINPYSTNPLHRTGCAGSGPSVSSGTTCNQYNTANGLQASTTGTIYGIYDMSGGAYEYVMGNMNDSSGQFYSASSGFGTAPDSKYYDSYVYDTSSTTHARGKLGDATRETMRFGFGGGGTGAWYSDNSNLPFSTSPWLMRGGHASTTTIAGAFASSYFTGSSANSISWRVVVVPL